MTPSKCPFHGGSASTSPPNEGAVAAGADGLPPIMDVLREATRDLHTRAEQQPMQRDLAKGRLPRAMYLAWLAEMRLIHAALDGALCALLHGTPPTDPTVTRVRSILRSIVRTTHFHTPAIDADLASLGAAVDAPKATTDATGLPATRDVAGNIISTTSTSPLGLLGMLYVLEGSTNGGKFLAKAVRRAYALEGIDGTRYLDPYGEAQPMEWQQFKDAMNAALFTHAEREAILDGANTMFLTVSDLSEQLAARELGGARRE